MESQDKGKEYEHNIWEIYLKEWATASPEKRTELNKRTRRWQELMKSGWTTQQAYYKAMEEELAFTVAEEPSDKSPGHSFWANMHKAPLVILGLALVAAIAYNVVITGDRNALNTELESVQSVLASAQVELSSTEKILTSTQSELASTQSDLDLTEETLTSTQSELASTQSDLDLTEETLASTQSELDSTEVELSSTKQELSSTQTELSSTKQTLDSTQSELSSTKEKLTSTETELELYKETGIEVFSSVQPRYEKGGFDNPRVYLEDESTATNPTWSELIAFLFADPTDDETYWASVFNCTNFAEMLHNNAETAGIKAAFVAVFFEGGEVGHALNAFRTTDKGLVYVDCTGRDIMSFIFGYVEYDKVAYVVKGKVYGLVSINRATSPEYSYYEQTGKSLSDWETDDIVESIEIYW